MSDRLTRRPIAPWANTIDGVSCLRCRNDDQRRRNPRSVSTGLNLQLGTRTMRLDDLPRSENVEDRRGNDIEPGGSFRLPGGRGGLGKTRELRHLQRGAAVRLLIGR